MSDLTSKWNRRIWRLSRGPIDNYALLGTIDDVLIASLQLRGSFTVLYLLSTCGETGRESYTHERGGRTKE